MGRGGRWLWCPGVVGLVPGLWWAGLCPDLAVTPPGVQGVPSAAGLLIGGAASLPNWLLSPRPSDPVQTGWWVGPGPALISWRQHSETVFTTSSVLVVGRAPTSGCSQCLCPRGESQLPPASPGGSPEISKWVWPRLLSHYRLCPGSPRVRDSVCAL